jgi:hypothetical protein
MSDTPTRYGTDPALDSIVLTRIATGFLVGPARVIDPRKTYHCATWQEAMDCARGLLSPDAPRPEPPPKVLFGTRET